MNHQIAAGIGPARLGVAEERRGGPDDPEMTSAVVHGFAHECFAAARDAFAASLASGDDVGASFCATLEGETVVDLWGGYADEAKTRPWEKDTIVNVYSTTKTMAALTALLLADRGELDFDAPVAAYWPEFAANGKRAITIRHLMSHASGLSGWREPFTGSDLYDAERAAQLLAAQAPLWEPGAASGYHVYTFGFLIGEVVRRITGKTLGTVFREEIAEPLHADFWIGLPGSEDPRVADLIPMPLPTNFDVSRVPEIMRPRLAPGGATRMAHGPPDTTYCYNR
jgi:CubicO group peptidase (beta-lactamase class C family)